MRKWILILAIIVIAFIGYNYVYHDHREISEEAATFHLSSIGLSNEFQINPQVSETKYHDKTIQVSGYISEVSTNFIILNSLVFCQFNDLQKKELQINQEVTIKGRFIGYDDLLEQVKLDQCHIIIN